MRPLHGRNTTLSFASIIVFGVAMSGTQADAAMVERSAEIGTPMPALSAHGAVSAGAGPVADSAPLGAVAEMGRGTGHETLVSIRFLNAAWSATVHNVTRSHVAFLIPDDPFGLWSPEDDAAATVGAAPVGYDLRIRQDMPVIVSAAAVMLASLLGWRLIAPPRQPGRKTRRRKAYSSGGVDPDDATSAGDVIRYILGSITPRFLKRRKRSRRRSSSSRGPGADGPETIGDVARVIAETVIPQPRHRKRRRRSRRSTAAHQDMRPT